VINIADDNEDRAVWNKLAAMKTDELVARRTIDRFGRRRYDRIRVFPKHYPRNHFAREKRRLRPLLPQTLFRVLFRKLDFVLWKRRMQYHVSHQRENTIVELRQS